MTEFKTDESAFNVAIAYLERIIHSFDKCKESAILGNAEMWVSWLRVVYREISAKLRKDEDGEFDEKFREINKLINDPVKRRTQRIQILYLLDQLEIKLRKKAQEKGMLLPSKDDPKFAILQR